MTVRHVCKLEPTGKHKCTLPDPSTMQWKWCVIQCNECGEYYHSQRKAFASWVNRVIYEHGKDEFKWVNIDWDEEQGAIRPPDRHPFLVP